MTKYYKGFSTRNYEETGRPFEIYNVDLVEEDLLNEIFTIVGDRLDLPNFGTRVRLLEFELNDLYTQDILREDMLKVFANDPRVQVLNFQIIPYVDRYMLVAIAKLLYVEFQVTKDLKIEVTNR